MWVIAAVVVSVLMLLSRFIEGCKPFWDHLPRVVTVLLPPVVLLLPHFGNLFSHTKAWADLIWYLIGALVMLIIGWFPMSHDSTTSK